MSVLGTMMMRAGLLSEGQVTGVGELASARSISHADAILELGLADEDTLVAFLASKLMIPRVRNSVLERVGAETIARISGVLAWDHGCLPISADELGNLTVVMSDPTDTRTLEAIVEHTDAYLVRAVATASDVRRALLRHYGTRDEALARETQAAAVASQPAAVESRPATPLDNQPVAPPPQSPVYASVGIPEDDDDVPIRASHGVAQEISSGPQSQPSRSQPEPEAPPESAAPYTVETRPAYPGAPVFTPEQPQAAPYLQDPTPADVHERPTMVDTGAPNIHARTTVVDTAAATPAPYMSAEDPHQRPTVVETQQASAAHLQRRQPPPATPVPATQTGATLVPPPPADDAAQAEPAQAEPAQAEPAQAESGRAEPAGPSRGPRRSRAHTPWNPPLADASPPGDPVPLSPEAFAQVLPLLEDANDRDEVTTLLLDFLGAGFERVILFVHSHNELRGLDARGKDLLVEAVRQVRIPSSGPSMFSEALERAAPYFGPAKSTNKIDVAFSQALGGIKGNVLLLPVKIGSKVPLLMWAHGTENPVDPRSITELSAAVSSAILRILAAARRKS